MIEARSLAYLEAMGIEAWSLRPAQRRWDQLVVGPGAGCTLLVCNNSDETGSVLATDIARALAAEPVWAWPDPEEHSSRVTLEESVRQGLFTTVLIFGKQLGTHIFSGGTPELLGSAKIHVTHSMETLRNSGAARKALWRLIYDTGVDQSRLS